jgi:hypothetical protein
MRKTLVVFLALAAQVFAGGFYLQLGNPEASPEARKLGAVLIVKATGCHDPASAKLSATAIGEVNGQRRTVPLEVKNMTEPGAFAIAGSWPKEGKWVIQINAINGEMFTNTLVAAGPNGLDRLHAKANNKRFDNSDVEAMLR